MNARTAAWLAALCPLTFAAAFGLTWLVLSTV